MTATRYCPFRLINGGLIPGNSQDAQSHNRVMECRADCALFQHEGCALANGAGSLYGIMQMLNAIMLLLKSVIMPETLPTDAAEEPAPEEIGGKE